MKSPLSYDVALVSPQDIVGIMPKSTPVFLKVIFEKPSGRILGAQAISKGAADKRIDVIATAIHFKATIRDLVDLELCYAPPFSTAKDVGEAGLCRSESAGRHIQTGIALGDRWLPVGCFWMSAKNMRLRRVPLGDQRIYP